MIGPKAVDPEDVDPEDVDPEDVDPEDVGPEDVGPEDVGPEDVGRWGVEARARSTCSKARTATAVESALPDSSPTKAPRSSRAWKSARLALRRVARQEASSNGGSGGVADSGGITFGVFSDGRANHT